MSYNIKKIHIRRIITICNYSKLMNNQVGDHVIFHAFLNYWNLKIFIVSCDNSDSYYIAY